VFTSAQSSTQTSTAQATALLQQSLTALAGSTTVSDIALTGTVRRIAGSDDETGSGVLRAILAGMSRIDLVFATGKRTEFSDLTGSMPAGTWSGPDGTLHSMAAHNVLAEDAWFVPVFAISRRLSNSNFVATYIGLENWKGQMVQHVSVVETLFLPNSPNAPAPTIEHLTRVDFFIASTSLLPVGISFFTHPDQNAAIDIPVEIDFGDYRSLGATMVPFHIQKFLNNTLLLDFQAE